MAKSKEEPATRTTTKVRVGYHRCRWTENPKGSVTADCSIEFDSDIGASETNELGRRIFDAYEFVRHQVERQVEEHSETWVKCVPLLEAAPDLVALEKLAALVEQRKADGKFHSWEVDDIDDLVSERRLMLTDTTNLFPAGDGTESKPEAKTQGGLV